MTRIPSYDLSPLLDIFNPEVSEINKIRRCYPQPSPGGRSSIHPRPCRAVFGDSAEKTGLPKDLEAPEHMTTSQGLDSDHTGYTLSSSPEW